MSGTKEKAADKQASKSRAGKTSAQKVAAVTGADSAGSESPVTLPGHYAAVGSAAIAPGIASASSFLRSDSAKADDVEVLEVRAIPAGGFWRCGWFWSATPWAVVVCDGLAGQTTPEGVPCISRDAAARLKAEPMLVVTTLETVTEPA
ncbi:hypothetical protein ACSVNO_05880 [Salmonella enterica]|uniref:hypothetical protein n=1 Tax=Salmonella enterica TaxID=28901 RepID=UPI003F3C8C92